MPESVRWLLSKGKTREANVIIQRIAKFNKKPLPDGMRLKAGTKAESTPSSLSLIRQVFSTKIRIGRFLILAYNW
jgi:hypothetical protein